MSKLTSKQRNKLPKSDFGLPSERKYPVDTKARAANAKARAQQQYDRGELTKSQLKRIDAMANNKLK